MSTTPDGVSNSISQPNIAFVSGMETPLENSGQHVSGSLAVNGNSENQVTASTSEPDSLYNITFTESGLQLDTAWIAILNGTMRASFGNPITFTEPNGSYSFSVQALNYTASLRSGMVVVYGHPVNVSITFTKGVKMGYLAGSLKPSNAEIEIFMNFSWATYKENNGKFNISLSPGTYRISVCARGYVAYSSTIAVNLSEITHLQITSMTPMNLVPIGEIAIVTTVSVTILALFVIVIQRAGKGKQ